MRLVLRACVRVYVCVYLCMVCVYNVCIWCVCVFRHMYTNMKKNQKFFLPVKVRGQPAELQVPKMKIKVVSYSFKHLYPLIYLANPRRGI